MPFSKYSQVYDAYYDASQTYISFIQPANPSIENGYIVIGLRNKMPLEIVDELV